MPFCNIYDADIRLLSEKYRLNLKYIYFTDYVSKKALLCDAAERQNKYWEVHDLIINQNHLNYSDLLKLAHQFDLDTIRLKKDIENPGLIKSLLNNRDVLIDMGFESVPAYLFKKTILHDPKSIERVLQNQCQI